MTKQVTLEQVITVLEGAAAPMTVKDIQFSLFGYRKVDGTYSLIDQRLRKAVRMGYGIEQIGGGRHMPHRQKAVGWRLKRPG